VQIYGRSRHGTHSVHTDEQPGALIGEYGLSKFTSRGQAKAKKAGQQITVAR
jgi:hypothetical protein